jgi:hypothetical protein
MKLPFKSWEEINREDNDARSAASADIEFLLSRGVDIKELTITGGMVDLYKRVLKLEGRGQI